MKTFLLPYPYKFAGFILAGSGIILAILYIWFDFRFFMPVIAILSWFLEMKWFVVLKTNFADELIMLSLLSGFFLIAFSKERFERKQWMMLRYKALFRALAVNSFFLFLSVIFVFGTAFIFILVVNLISIFIFYLIFFYSLKRKALKKQL
jgi:hypothetical protein